MASAQGRFQPAALHSAQCRPIPLNGISVASSRMPLAS
jgi:hypothetical protein